MVSVRKKSLLSIEFAITNLILICICTQKSLKPDFKTSFSISSECVGNSKGYKFLEKISLNFGIKEFCYKKSIFPYNIRIKNWWGWKIF